MNYLNTPHTHTTLRRPRFAQAMRGLLGAVILMMLAACGGGNERSSSPTGAAPGSTFSIGGNFWLMGGTGIDDSATSGKLNDVWKYVPSTGQWTWVAGSRLRNAWGVYGTLGVPNVANTPGAREWGVTWVDSSDNLWLFGGSGYDIGGTDSMLNDLWKFNPATGLWTWVAKPAAAALLLLGSGAWFAAANGAPVAPPTPPATTVVVNASAPANQQAQVSATANGVTQVKRAAKQQQPHSVQGWKVGISTKHRHPFKRIEHAMKFTCKWLVTILLPCCCLAACGFVSQQLKDKADEERLLRPGALDTDIPTNLTHYRIGFLGRYRISHSWPVTSACKYRSQPTKQILGASPVYDEVRLVRDIYEDGNSTWLLFPKELGGAFNFDHYVRSRKVLRPVYESTNGVIEAGKPTRYEETESGLQPMCFQAWVGTSQSLTLRFYRLPLEARVAHYSKRKSFQSREVIGDQSWLVWRYELEPDNPKVYGGEVWLTAVGDSGYTLALELGEGAQLSQFPNSRVALRSLFRRLIESVKVEPLTPAIEAEQEQLKIKAEAIVRQECLDSSKTGKPGFWCDKYLKP